MATPIPEGWGKRGRPPHQPTDDNRSKIRVLLAFGYLVPAIAKALRINKGTLRKYYLAELKHADEAMPALKGANLFAMVKSALGGNVGAQKQLQALIEKHDLAQLGAPAPAPKPPALGKKEKA